MDSSVWNFVLWNIEKWRQQKQFNEEQSIHTSSPAEAWRIESGTEVGEKWCPQLLRSSSRGVPTWKENVSIELQKRKLKATSIYDIS